MIMEIYLELFKTWNIIGCFEVFRNFLSGNIKGKLPEHFSPGVSSDKLNKFLFRILLFQSKLNASSYYDA